MLASPVVSYWGDLLDISYGEVIQLRVETPQISIGSQDLIGLIVLWPWDPNQQNRL